MIAQIKGLSNAEANYFRSLRNAIKYDIDVDKALKNNQMYYDKLFDLYKNTETKEDKTELAFELEYLVEQARLLKNIQLNSSEETA